MIDKALIREMRLFLKGTAKEKGIHEGKIIKELGGRGDTEKFIERFYREHEHKGKDGVYKTWFFEVLDAALAVIKKQMLEEIKKGKKF